jgi:O-methyltransferase
MKILPGLQIPLTGPGPKLLQILNATRYGLSTDGEIWECGVFQGSAARWIAFQMSEYMEDVSKTLRLFDTFKGRPEKGRYDTGSNTHFDNTTLELVQRHVPWNFVKFHQGVIPETFVGLEDCKISFAHLDMDLYQSTVDALDFILPRLVENGLIIVDDYDTPEWPGVKIAIEDLLDQSKGYSYRSRLVNTCMIGHKGTVEKIWT